MTKFQDQKICIVHLKAAEIYFKVKIATSKVEDIFLYEQKTKKLFDRRAE